MARDAKAEHIHGFHYYFVGAASLLRLEPTPSLGGLVGWWVRPLNRIGNGKLVTVLAR
jgi:hypothetical protein